MPSEITPASAPLSTREGESQQAQFSVSDYGRVGDQRPYQIVFPSYPAPKFLSRYQYLKDALRECGTLCQLSGKPFKLVKWGAPQKCFPCRPKKRTNKLPSLRIHSVGALEGFPDALPIADFRPNSATMVYGPDGQPKLVGAPNYVVTRTPNPWAEFSFPQPIPQRYLEAVKTAQYLAAATGRNAYLCSSMGGGGCAKKSGKNWIPVVYVDPGGLVRAYPSELALPNSPEGSITATQPVSEEVFQELVRESAGASRLGQGA